MNTSQNIDKITITAMIWKILAIKPFDTLLYLVVSFFITVVNILSCCKKYSHVDIISLKKRVKRLSYDIGYILERMIILYLNCWYIIISDSKELNKWNISISVFKYRGMSKHSFIWIESYMDVELNIIEHIYIGNLSCFSCFVIF